MTTRTYGARIYGNERSWEVPMGNVFPRAYLHPHARCSNCGWAPHTMRVIVRPQSGAYPT